MKEKTHLLIVGAGPFGLSLAAYLKDNNIEHIHLGHSMDYWKDQMPKGMYLRSPCDWHFDAVNEETIIKYLALQNLTVADVEPLTVDFYLNYAHWFQSQKGLAPRSRWVKSLNHIEDGFCAMLDDGSEIEAKKVVLAVGLRDFKHIPEVYSHLFPKNSIHHTADLVDFSALKDKRILIIGGRQSAFEWAALIQEQGAQAVHLSYRHDTPVFEAADWQWVEPVLENMVNQPSWFRTLSAHEKDQISQRIWADGRLKLEPWLLERIAKENIITHPHTYVIASKEISSKVLQITLNDQSSLLIDHIVFATGYKMDITRMPLLNNGNLMDQINAKNGFPVLDERFQCSVPNLYFTGFAASQDFGPFFGFTAAVRTSARTLGPLV
ncbi:MAG: hypothetical protein RLZ75_1755 [Pseudomonadota bacterium]